MTESDQQHIIAQMQQHLAANMGNRITDALAHGLLAVLSIITSERIAKDAPKEPEHDIPAV